jgi:hypothetical protein
LQLLQSPTPSCSCALSLYTLLFPPKKLLSLPFPPQSRQKSACTRRRKDLLAVSKDGEGLNLVGEEAVHLLDLRGDGKVNESIADLNLEAANNGRVNLGVEDKLLAVSEGLEGLGKSGDLLLGKGCGGDNGSGSFAAFGHHKLVECVGDLGGGAEAAILGEHVEEGGGDLVVIAGLRDSRDVAGLALAVKSGVVEEVSESRDIFDGTLDGLWN